MSAALAESGERPCPEKKTRPPPIAMIESKKERSAGPRSLYHPPLGSRIDTDSLSILSELFKGNNPIDLGEQRVVPATPHVGAGMDLRAELPDDDIAGLDDLSAEFLYTTALTAAVAAVPGTAACLLMSHDSLLITVGKRKAARLLTG